MSVPEASMYENGDPVFGQDHIRSAAHGLGVKPVAEPARMKCAAQQELWTRVLAAYSRHHSGTSLLVDNICHLAPGIAPLTWYTGISPLTRGP